MLEIALDLNQTTGQCRSAVTDSQFIHMITDGSSYRKYNWNGQQLNSTLTITNTPITIVMATTASAVVVGSATTVDVINVSTNVKSTIAGGAATFTTNWGQQAATDKNGIVIITKATNGQVTKFNASTQAFSTLSPTSLTGAQATSVLYKPDTSTYLLGTNTGKVLEVDASGNSIKSITLPNTPNISAPTITVTGLSYYNDVLVCTTSYCEMYFYKYSTGANLYTMPIPAASNSAATCSLSDSASGHFAIATGNGATITNMSMTAYCFMPNASSSPTFDTVFCESITRSISCGIEPTQNQAWFAYFNSAGNGIQFRSYKIPPIQQTTIPTRGQDPIGIDVSQRVIRIRRDRPGQGMVEVDVTVPSGSQNVACTDGHNYIELSKRSGKWDIREFKS